ncbi:hypothetical protein MAR_027021, partial [Mya arenaria]
AFQRVQVEFNHPGARLVRIKEDLYEGALDVARKFFMTGEPINKAVGMEWTDELRGLWLSSFRLHFSLAAVNEADEQIQTSGLKRLFVYCNYCDQKADFFNYFGVEEAFHFYGLACADKYKNQGLASKLFKAAVDMIRYLDNPGVHIKGEATSNYSKMIYDNAGFKELFDQPFETFIVDGEVVVPNTGIHKSMKVYGFKAT